MKMLYVDDEEFINLVLNYCKQSVEERLDCSQDYVDMFFLRTLAKNFYQQLGCSSIEFLAYANGDAYRVQLHRSYVTSSIGSVDVIVVARIYALCLETLELLLHLRNFELQLNRSDLKIHTSTEITKVIANCAWFGIYHNYNPDFSVVASIKGSFNCIKQDLSRINTEIKKIVALSD